MQGTLTDHMGAVVLVVGLALRALQARPHLRTNANPIANLHVFHFGPNLDGLSNDFMSNTYR